YHLRSGLGIALRAHRSSLGSDDLVYADVSGLVALGGLIERLAGPGARQAVGYLAAEVALGFQTGYEPSTQLEHGEEQLLTRVGVRASTPLAPTPLSLELRLSRLMQPGVDAPLTGFDGDTGLRWAFRRWPGEVGLGYRFQRFDVNGAAQEISAMRLEIAWRGGGR
ncbi:MAG: hypothetical protein ACYC0B_08865, partial [Gemmatimonadaceae bacterium]